MLSSQVDICTGESVVLQAGGAAQYTWAPAVGLSNPSIANPIANPSVTTVYTVTGRNEFGCTSELSVEVRVLTPPEVEFDRVSVDFGQLDACTSSGNETITLTNPGGSPITIDEAQFELGTYVLVAPTLPITVPAQSSQDLVIRFAPGIAGTF